MTWQTGTAILYLLMVIVLAAFTYTLEPRRQQLIRREGEIIPVMLKDSFLNSIRVGLWLLMPWLGWLGLNIAKEMAEAEASPPTAVIELLTTASTVLMWTLIFVMGAFGLILFKALLDKFMKLGTKQNYKRL